MFTPALATMNFYVICYHLSYNIHAGVCRNKCMCVSVSSHMCVSVFSHMSGSVSTHNMSLYLLTMSLSVQTVNTIVELSFV